VAAVVTSPLTRPRDVVQSARRVARELIEDGQVFGLTDVDVRAATDRMAVFWLTLEPWTSLAAEGFPTERVAITITSNGWIAAVPLEAHGRRWYHRNRYELGSMENLGALCLWYPGDPRSLRWEWSDGFVAYIRIVHRHLQAEEYWRRHDRWPVEDAPHGEGNHPIRSLEMRAAAGAAA
jgi:hypothetical protein